jgi:hypothetical protein
MEERRKDERLKQEDEMTISVLSGGSNLPKDKIIYTLSKHISVSGTRIQANSFLPVDTLLNIKVTLKHPPQMITALGKVKWVRSLYADEFFEAGLEFFNTSRVMN